MADKKKKGTTTKASAKPAAEVVKSAANTSVKPVEAKAEPKVEVKAEEKAPAQAAKPVKKKAVAKKKATPAAKAKTSVKKAPAKAAAKKADIKPKKAKEAVKKAPAKKVVTKKAPVKKVATPKKKTTLKKSVNKAPIQNVSEAVKAEVKGMKEKLFGNQQSMEKIMTQGKTQIDKVAKEAVELNRQHIEAVVKSTSIFTKGLEEIVRMSMNLAQDLGAKQSQYVKEAMGSKTLNEWAEVNSKIAKSHYDDLVAGATKISDLSTKTLNEAIEPINSHVTKAVKKASDLMAA